jgi:hypothetical protein
MSVGVFWPAPTTQVGGSSGVSSRQVEHDPEEPLSMMTQGNYVMINDLHKLGWSIFEIAEATGWHRTTVSNYLKNGPPPQARAIEPTAM